LSSYEAGHQSEGRRNDNVAWIVELEVSRRPLLGVEALSVIDGHAEQADLVGGAEGVGVLFGLADFLLQE